MRSIDEIHVYHVRMPLLRPYHLSFKKLQEFDIILVEVRSGADVQYGESVPLYGYSDESFDDVWARLIDWKKRFEGASFDRLFAELSEWRQAYPFSTTPLWTPLEMLQNPIQFEQEREYPLLGTLHAAEKKQIEAEINQLLKQGYKTIKVKVGMQDAAADVEKIRFIQEIVGRQAMLRIDANQGYRLEEAEQLVTRIDPENVELFEQPFDQADWESMLRLSAVSQIPLMLDESIHTEEDVERAADSRCAQFVKFKLMKAGSLANLRRLIGKAHQLGLKVILGNGVAGEIGNLHEILVAHSLLQNAGEMNGFLKQQTRLFRETWPLVDGKVRIPKGYRLSIDSEQLARLTVQQG